MEGDVLVGHGGQIGRGCRLGSSMDVVEVGSGKMRQTISVLALRAQAAAGGHWLHHRAPRRRAVAVNAASPCASPLVPLRSCVFLCVVVACVRAIHVG